MVIGESSVSDERALVERFGEEYRFAQAQIMLEIERNVCGCDYGATSWTTRQEAQEAAELLMLGPGKRLLEVGAGSGWPGLYLANTTGCDVILADLPLEGLKIAATRAAADRPTGTCWITVANGAALPFMNTVVDAVFHSDVLCCLTEKLTVLTECRRVLRAGGKMVFTVISIPQGLSSADYRQAVACGPPFIETTIDYPTMLEQTGWSMARHIDLTAEYETSVRQLLRQEKVHAQELQGLLGDTEYAERLARRRRALRAIEQGLLQREMYSVT